MIKFKTLSGNLDWKAYGCKWVSNKLNNGDFDYWFVLELINWENSTGELNNGHKYNVSLSAVFPSEAGEENLKRAFGFSGTDEDTHKFSDLIKVEALYAYGVHAQIWNKNGNNANELIRLGKEEVMRHFLKGDIGAGLKRIDAL